MVDLVIVMVLPVTIITIVRSTRGVVVIALMVATVVLVITVVAIVIVSVAVRCRYSRLLLYSWYWCTIRCRKGWLSLFILSFIISYLDKGEILLSLRRLLLRL